MGANDGQFDPELRTVFIFSANYLDFSYWRFKVMVTSLPTFHGPKCLQIYFCYKNELYKTFLQRKIFSKHFLIKSIDYFRVLNSQL